MELSYFLAALFGPYLVVMGVLCLLRRDFLQQAIASFFNNPALLLLSGASSLLFGILVLLVHPSFELDWRLLITILLGIIPFIRGIIRLFYPEFCKKMALKWIQSNGILYSGIIALILGFFLTYKGFLS